MELPVPSGNDEGCWSNTQMYHLAEPVFHKTKKVEWVVASFHANQFCAYRQVDQIGGWYVSPFDPFLMAMFLPQQYMALDSGSRSPISLGQVPLPVPNLLYVGHTFQDRRQRQDLMIVDVYYRIFRACGIIRPCKYAIIRFSTNVGSQREDQSSFPLCHASHM